MASDWLASGDSGNAVIPLWIRFDRSHESIGRKRAHQRNAEPAAPQFQHGTSRMSEAGEQQRHVGGERIHAASFFFFFRCSIRFTASSKWVHHPTAQPEQDRLDNEYLANHVAMSAA